MSNKQINSWIKTISSLFETIKKENRMGCGDEWCGKCKGRYELALSDGVSEADRKMIGDMLNSVSLPDLARFGKWKRALKIIDPHGYFSVFHREIDVLDTSNVRQVDIFLYEVKSMLHEYRQPLSDIYTNTLQEGIQLAINSGDSSLIETIIIALGEKANNHPELINKALDISKNDKQMQRVLYNCLRHIRPDVRGYNRDVIPWHLKRLKIARES